MSKRTLMGYSHAFLEAAEAHASLAKEKGIDGEVDGMMSVIALQNAVVGATKILGQDHPAVRICRDQVRDLKNVRDMITHFDAYAMGAGNLQKSLDGADGPFGWMPMWNTPETILILTRRRGEREATHYEVPIHQAVRSVAVLVAAAADSLHLRPSPLPERLIGAD